MVRGLFFVVVVMVALDARASAYEMLPSSSESRDDVWLLARERLLAVLARRYPQVIGWALAPQFGSAHRREFPEGTPTSVEVLRVGSRSSVRLLWRGADSVQQTRSLWFEVVGKEQAVVMLRDINAGAPVSRADATMGLRDAMQRGCTTLTSVETLQGMRATRTLRAGMAACREALELRPPVARGEAVTVRYFSERVLLATVGIAQEDGHVGQRLRVLNSASRESFQAVVSAAAEVTVHE